MIQLKVINSDAAQNQDLVSAAIVLTPAQIESILDLLSVDPVYTDPAYRVFGYDDTSRTFFVMIDKP